jgi:outer membrane receptor for ferric coprogen and ferric-rhodotorulic acid
MSFHTIHRRSNLSPNLLAIAIGMASIAPALAEETAATAHANGPLELQATEIGATQMSSTTEDTQSYTTGPMQTATKLSLTMRETPQAVTVITRQRMDDQNMTSVNDVVRGTPGLFLSEASGPGRQTYKARGFDIDNIMYDGLPSSYSPFTLAVQPNLAMFDRVEIVRGATGLVTGAGNPSAAINMVRKRPTADQRVTLTGAAGSWDDYRGEVDASSPLNDSGTLRGRVVTSYQGADSFRDKEENDHGLFYAIGEADLSDSTTATLGFSRQNDQTNYFWAACRSAKTATTSTCPAPLTRAPTGKTASCKSTPYSVKSNTVSTTTGNCTSAVRPQPSRANSPARTCRATTARWKPPPTNRTTPTSNAPSTVSPAARSKRSAAPTSW